MSEKTWPELGEELGRKAMEAIHAAGHRYNEEEISERELWLICDSIYDCVSGLVPWETANTIYAIRQELKRD